MRLFASIIDFWVSRAGRVVTVYRRYTKRVLDVGFSVVGLAALCPLMLLLGLAVRLTVGAPVLFRQDRPGWGGHPFRLLKFRTMHELEDDLGRLRPDEERMGRFGRWMRRMSLDELPELWNVLRGEMSLVGPRPLLMHYLERYSPEQARRHEVRPGITGWAQVNGRNLLSWEEKFSHDVWYVDNVGLLTDMRILLLTFRQLFQGGDISAPGHATMPEFMGTDIE